MRSHLFLSKSVSSTLASISASKQDLSLGAPNIPGMGASLADHGMYRPFPRPWIVPCLLFSLSLLVYVCSMSWTPFPGLPTRELLRHLKMESTPATLDLVWGWGVRIAERMPLLSVAGWMGLFSAVCGSAAVALLGQLMLQVGYIVPDEPRSDSLRREAQARRLSGLVAGLYLAFTIPFWIVSTRSLPGAFHVLWLLATTWLYFQYNQGGKRRYLFLFGLGYGAGMAEFATLILAFPLAILMAIRSTLRWRRSHAWLSHVLFWAGLALGLSLYALNAALLYRHGLAAQVFSSPWQAFIQIGKEQFALIGIIRFSPGFLVITFVSLVPWLALFAMSSRSPWFYEQGQIFSRLIFVVGLLAVLGNISFAPWNLMGMASLVVTPYVLLAISMGYLAGEFWILGEDHVLMDFRRKKRAVRRLYSAFALALPFAILVVGVRNWKETDGRQGEILHVSATEILDGLEGPAIIFSGGVLDGPLRLAIRERRLPIVLISLPRTASPVYLNEVSKYFKNESLTRPLALGDFNQFLDNLMMAEMGAELCAIVDMPDMFREYGYVIPNGFVFRVRRDDPSKEYLAQRMAELGPFFERMLEMATRLAVERNPAHVYQQYLCLMASRVANNLGTMQADRGDVVAAYDSFRMAWLIFPENASALLNMLGAALHANRPDAEEVQRLWAERMGDLKGDRWALCSQYGHVWDARQWLPRGWVWALSGMPTPKEAARLTAQNIENSGVESQSLLLDKIYLQWGIAPQEAASLRNQLARDPRNSTALLELFRTALRQGDILVADAYLEEAQAVGVPEQELLFERAMADLVRGDRPAVVGSLERLAHLAPGDIRVWAGLALLTHEKDPGNANAIRMLRNHPKANAVSSMVISSILMDRGLWEEAMVELEKAVQHDARNMQAWELMLNVARETDNARLVESCMNALIAIDPTHFIQYQNLGVGYYRKGEWRQAESAFRDGLRIRRDPTLLNNLAHVLNQSGADSQEALALIDEALRRQPGNPSMLNTRAEIYLRMGRVPDARRDILDSLRHRGRNADPLLSIISYYLDSGDLRQAESLIKVASAIEEHMDEVQARRLNALRDRLSSRLLAQ